MLYPWISRCWVKEEKARKAKTTRKVKAKGKRGESSKDEKDKDKEGRGKGKNNAKTEYFAGYCLQCKGWGHMKKDCWWNENAENAKRTASLETPATPAESTKTEPLITGMLIQSDEGGEIPADPAQWMYSVTNQESVPIANDFLIDSGAATSVGVSAEFSRQPGWTIQRTWSGAQGSHWTSVHDDRQHDNLLTHTRRCQRGEGLSDCTQEH